MTKPSREILFDSDKTQQKELLPERGPPPLAPPRPPRDDGALHSRAKWPVLPQLKHSLMAGQLRSTRSQVTAPVQNTSKINSHISHTPRTEALLASSIVTSRFVGDWLENYLH